MSLCHCILTPVLQLVYLDFVILTIFNKYAKTIFTGISKFDFPIHGKWLETNMEHFSRRM